MLCLKPSPSEQFRIKHEGCPDIVIQFYQRADGSIRVAFDADKSYAITREPRASKPSLMPIGNSAAEWREWSERNMSRAKVASGKDGD